MVWTPLRWFRQVGTCYCSLGRFMSSIEYSVSFEHEGSRCMDLTNLLDLRGRRTRIGNFKFVVSTAPILIKPVIYSTSSLIISIV